MLFVVLHAGKVCSMNTVVNLESFSVWGSVNYTALFFLSTSSCAYKRTINCLRSKKISTDDNLWAGYGAAASTRVSFLNYECWQLNENFQCKCWAPGHEVCMSRCEIESTFHWRDAIHVGHVLVISCHRCTTVWNNNSGGRLAITVLVWKISTT